MRSQGGALGLGIPSILLVFVALCLTAAGVLSFVQADTERALSRRSAEHVTAYYAAAGEIQQQLAELDARLLAALALSDGDEDIYRQGLARDGVGDGSTVLLEARVADDISIVATVEISPPGANRRYAIRSHIMR